jgi:hypothetical protein
MWFLTDIFKEVESSVKKFEAFIKISITFEAFFKEIATLSVLFEYIFTGIEAYLK